MNSSRAFHLPTPSSLHCLPPLQRGIEWMRDLRDALKEMQTVSPEVPGIFDICAILCSLRQNGMKKP
jgi:hypothetical protein